MIDSVHFLSVNSTSKFCYILLYFCSHSSNKICSRHFAICFKWIWLST